jgi:hypothetical protein
MTATIELPEDIREALTRSGAEGRPMIVSFCDPEGREHPSYRGSTHVHGPGQLALWVRNPAGGLPRAVAQHGAVTILYRNQETGEHYRLSGIARLEDDPEVRDRVYADSPPHEQAADPERRGVAMIVEIVRLGGVRPDGPVLLEPSAA